MYYVLNRICIMQTFIAGYEMVSSDKKIWQDLLVICFQNNNSKDLVLSKVTHSSLKKINCRVIH